MNKTLWQYYVDKANEITQNAFGNIKNLKDWEKEKERLKKEFFISVGLYPIPEKCELSIKIAGEIKKPGFIIKKIVYQIYPDCYSSGHLYLPDPLPEKKLPAVLYVCGHSGLGTYWYHAHGVMWAKRGYACFIFDTIRQSENTGDHHGLYTGTRLDWISRGYLSAGGELLNSICALDVLCQMPEIDRERIGTTGISGGGAHSHFLAIADERIKAVATSAGISVIYWAIGNRTMFQHCDCMYTYGNFQRDISEFSALIAPRPILYCFASDDNLFFREEYQTLYEKVKKIYKLYGCQEKCELFEYPGPHAYSDASVKKINDWFDRYVAREKHPEIKLEANFIPEAELAIFNGKSPAPNRLNLLPELLTVQKTRYLPETQKNWEKIRCETVQQLKKNVFHWLDRCDEKLMIKNTGKWILEGRKFHRYTGEVSGMECYIETFFPEKKAKITIIATGDYKHDTHTLREKIFESAEGCNLVFVEQRACGRNAADIGQGNFCLYRAGAFVGITPVMMWINDLKYIVEYFRKVPECRDTNFVLYGTGEAAGSCLYYGIFDEKISAVILDEVVDTHAKGCYIPGIMKEIDITEATGLIAPRVFAVVYKGMPGWFLKMHWGIRVYERLGIKDRYIMTHRTYSAFERVIEKVSE
ncbi:MAG: acetylxylan esterase [Candidatus Omnitrophica bacterium]|nr:acetylxylan esterase [Candidatus Omnitrophota bacterium]